MTCEQARLALLDTDPDELRSAADGALSDHLCSCHACRAQAAVITAGTDTLRAAFDMTVASRSSETDAARAAERALQTHHERDDVTRQSRVRQRRARHLAVRALIPLAAAAMLTLLLFDAGALRLPSADAPFADLYVPEPNVPDAPVVNAAGGSGVAVMQTTNPAITVVWTF